MWPQPKDKPLLFNKRFDFFEVVWCIRRERDNWERTQRIIGRKQSGPYPNVEVTRPTHNRRGICSVRCVTGTLRTIHGSGIFHHRNVQGFHGFRLTRMSLATHFRVRYTGPTHTPFVIKARFYYFYFSWNYSLVDVLLTTKSRSVSSKCFLPSFFSFIHYKYSKFFPTLC